MLLDPTVDSRADLQAQGEAREMRAKNPGFRENNSLLVTCNRMLQSGSEVWEK